MEHSSHSVVLNSTILSTRGEQHHGRYGQVLFSFFLNKCFPKYSMNLRYWQQFRVTASQRNSLRHKLQALYKNIIPPRKLGTRDLKIDQQNSVQNRKRHREQFENWRSSVKQDWTSFLRFCPEMWFRAFQWPCCFHSCIYHRSFYVSAQIHKFSIVCTQGQYLVSLKKKEKAKWSDICCKNRKLQ